MTHGEKANIGCLRQVFVQKHHQNSFILQRCGSLILWNCFVNLLCFYCFYGYFQLCSCSCRCDAYFLLFSHCKIYTHPLSIARAHCIAFKRTSFLYFKGHSFIFFHLTKVNYKMATNFESNKVKTQGNGINSGIHCKQLSYLFDGRR